MNRKRIGAISWNHYTSLRWPWAAWVAAGGGWQGKGDGSAAAGAQAHWRHVMLQAPLDGARIATDTPQVLLGGSLAPDKIAPQGSVASRI